jgi:hypothetical protein
MGIIKATVLLIVLFMVSGCSGMNGKTEFAFYDAYGALYNSSTAGLNVKKEFNLESKPKLVVIATSSKYNPKFIEQMNILSKVNAEEMNYMYIIANSEEEDRSGYYFRKAEAANFLSGDSFKIAIYDENGEAIKKSDHIIRSNDLKFYLAEVP